MAALEGNQNARKPSAGVQVNFYLSVQEKEDIQKKLLERGNEPTKHAVRAFAREQSKNGLHLALKGKCDIPECYQAASVECRIGHCAPLKRYCAYHYEHVHLPEDERDEVQSPNQERKLS